MSTLYRKSKNDHSKKDGTKYVEVHHIKNLSEEYDEEGTLDRLNNLIVVCPNHHKMLHYHNGGYRKIEKTNNVFSFYQRIFRHYSYCT
ncbi:MAG: HNH endonuclease [Anaerobutyricum soehngenii]